MFGFILTFMLHFKKVPQNKLDRNFPCSHLYAVFKKVPQNKLDCNFPCSHLYAAFKKVPQEKLDRNFPCSHLYAAFKKVPQEKFDRNFPFSLERGKETHCMLSDQWRLIPLMLKSSSNNCRLYL